MVWQLKHVDLQANSENMVPFLKQVARYYYDSGKISSRCFIFPNRRSMVFFRKHLAETLAAADGAAPLVMPRMLTINDFFYEVSGAAPADKVRLLLYLYRCYAELNKKAEPLDEFVFWGDVILGDFNDVDKKCIIGAAEGTIKEISLTFWQRLINWFNRIIAALTGLTLSGGLGLG